MSVFYKTGVYWVEFIEQALSAASTGTPQIVLRFKVLGPESKEDPSLYYSDTPQYERTAFLSVTEKTMQYMPAKLAALGYTGESLARLDPRHPQHHSFVGHEAKMYCKEEPGQNGGEPRERWDVATGGGSKPIEVKPVDSKTLRSLDMLFAKQVKSSGGTKPQPVAAPAPAPVSVADDDVPF